MLARLFFFHCFAALVLWAALSRARGAAAGEPIDWLTGRELRQQRGARIGVTWSGVPLRRGLEDLARSQRIAVLLDRRIDPDRTLELTVENEPIEEILERVAREHDLGLSWFGPVAYLGPQAAARRLRTVSTLRENEARQLSPQAQKALLRERAFKWDDLATPRELIEKLADEGRLKLEGLEQVPHDLWPAAEGPPLKLVERLSLLLGEFDLTFRFDDEGRTLVLISVPDEVAIEKSYPGGKDPREKAERWSNLAPGSQIEVVGGKIVVRGLVEDHERLMGQAASTASTTAKTDEIRYTLAVREQQLGPVLEQLAAKLKLELQIDRDALAKAGISLDERVTFQVEKATADELFSAALAPVGLSFRREGKMLKVFPAARPK